MGVIRVCIFDGPRVATAVEGPEGRDTFHVGHSGTHWGDIMITYSREGDDVISCLRRGVDGSESEKEVRSPCQPSR